MRPPNSDFKPGARAPFLTISKFNDRFSILYNVPELAQRLRQRLLVNDINPSCHSSVSNSASGHLAFNAARNRSLWTGEMTMLQGDPFKKWTLMALFEKLYFPILSLSVSTMRTTSKYGTT